MYLLRLRAACIDYDCCAEERSWKSSDVNSFMENMDNSVRIRYSVEFLFQVQHSVIHTQCLGNDCLLDNDQLKTNKNYKRVLTFYLCLFASAFFNFSISKTCFNSLPSASYAASAIQFSDLFYFFNSSGSLAASPFACFLSLSI